MKTIIKKVSVKNRPYKKAYKSTYSETLKWKIILPEEVHSKLIDALENNPPKFNFNDEIGLYFLSLISHIPSFKKDETYIGGFVNLSSKKMLKVSRNYRKYLDYFIDNCIIDENSSYSNKKSYCKSYRYNEKGIKTFTWKIIEFDMLKETYKKLETKEKKLCKRPAYLSKWLNSKLNIDFEGVLNEIQEKLKFTSQTELRTLKKAENYLRSLKNIHFKEFWSSRNPKSDNRYHSNLTNMPKIFRKWVTYDDKNLAGIDIKNSQPYFLIILIEILKKNKIEYYNRKQRNSKGLEGNRDFNVEKNKDKYNKIMIISRVYSGTMFYTLLQTLNCSGFQEEYKSIKSDILNGKFYDNLEPHFKFEKTFNGKFKRKFFNKNTNKQQRYYFNTKRDVVKRLLLFFLYKNNQTNIKKEDKEYLIFKRIYPNFCKVLELLKHDNKKDLPQLLQHLEADCILDYTCKKISDKYPNLPLFTIHDSIITTEDYIHLLKKETKMHIFDYCNDIKPTLKIEYWHSYNSNFKTA